MKYDLVISLLEQKLHVTKQERVYWKRRKYSTGQEDRLIPDIESAIALLRAEQTKEEKA